MWTSSPSCPHHMFPPVPRVGPMEPGHLPGVAVHLDLVSWGVQVMVVHAWAVLLRDTATTAIVQQPTWAYAATDTLRLILQGPGSGAQGFDARSRGLSRPYSGPPRLLTLWTPLCSPPSVLPRAPCCAWRQQGLPPLCPWWARQGSTGRHLLPQDREGGKACACGIPPPPPPWWPLHARGRQPASDS